MELVKQLDRRATEPSIIENGNENGISEKKAESHKDITYNGKPTGK